MGSEGKTDVAWRQVLENYPIIETVEQGGLYRIKAADIKRFREPRLMTKHDTSEGVPLPLKKHYLNVLALSRNEYVIGDFDLYQPFPDVSDLRPQLVSLPDFQTLRSDGITSESNAINALMAGGILDCFLESESTAETFNGRMGSGDFEFDVSRRSGTPAHISVHGAQLEIDGGFENDDSVIIMEAKNVIHDDFNVRQLYYPFRKYRSFVTKPIRLVFSQYTNLTYYLYEYVFENPLDYSSIALVGRRSYTFEDKRITTSELWERFEATRVRTDDNMTRAGVPFIQADRFDRVIALMERLQDEPDGLSTEEIAEFMGTTMRQAAYYPAAGAYLGLFDRATRGITKLSSKAKDLLQMDYRDRQLAFAGLMFEHEIFHRLFEKTFTSGSLPTKGDVVSLMNELNVCGPDEKGTTYRRRASSVIGWLRWLMSVPDEDY